MPRRKRRLEVEALEGRELFAPLSPAPLMADFDDLNFEMVLEMPSLDEEDESDPDDLFENIDIDSKDNKASMVSHNDILMDLIGEGINLQNSPTFNTVFAYLDHILINKITYIKTHASLTAEYTVSNPVVLRPNGVTGFKLLVQTISFWDLDK